MYRALCILIWSIYGRNDLDLDRLDHIAQSRGGRFELVVFGIVAPISGICIGLAGFDSETATRLDVMVALGFFFICLPLIWVVARVSSVPLWREHSCGTCGYNLNGNQSGICPECGTLIQETKDLPT